MWLELPDPIDKHGINFKCTFDPGPCYYWRPKQCCVKTLLCPTRSVFKNTPPVHDTVEKLTSIILNIYLPHISEHFYWNKLECLEFYWFYIRFKEMLAIFSSWYSHIVLYWGVIYIVPFCMTFLFCWMSSYSSGPRHPLIKVIFMVTIRKVPVGDTAVLKFNMPELCTGIIPQSKY